MKRFNSTIVQKKCKCSESCDKYPTMGYKGYYIKHFPGEMPSKRDKTSIVRGKLERATKVKTKSDHLKVADILFSRWIKNRDSDSLGNISCVCCGGTYNLKDKDSSGDYIVQCMHFVPRAVYSLRFDEINCHAGCSMCNSHMHNEPDGIRYKQYKRYLIDAVGEDHVRWMEEQKRCINKLTEAEILLIIDKYKKIKL